MGHLSDVSPGAVHLSNVSPGVPNCRVVLVAEFGVALEERLVIGGILGFRGDVGNSIGARGFASGTGSIGTTVVSSLGTGPDVELAATDDAIPVALVGASTFDTVIRERDRRRAAAVAAPGAAPPRRRCALSTAVIISPSRPFAYKAPLHRRSVGASMSSIKVIV